MVSVGASLDLQATKGQRKERGDDVEGEEQEFLYLRFCL
jgi:hypothetical protein